MPLLEKRKIAILTEDGFEESELMVPKKALEEAGADVHILSPTKDMVRGWKGDGWSSELQVDHHLDEVRAEDYDGLMIPGGVANPDLLRRSDKAIQFARSFFEQGKPIASICHGPQLLIETGALQGREMTSFSSISTDLKNAGARWVNKEVVVDEGLVTSRSPEDLEAFVGKMIEEFAEGVHSENRTAI